MATAAETITTEATAAAQAGADRLQAMFGDVSGKTRAAVEKSTKLYEEMGDFSKGNVEALMTSGRIAAEGFGVLTREAVAFGKKSMEDSMSAWKALASVKTPADFFQVQQQIARSSFDAVVSEGSKSTEQLVKLVGDIVQPLSSRVSLAAEKVKSTTV